MGAPLLALETNTCICNSRILFSTYNSMGFVIQIENSGMIYICPLRFENQKETKSYSKKTT